MGLHPILPNVQIKMGCDKGILNEGIQLQFGVEFLNDTVELSIQFLKAIN